MSSKKLILDKLRAAQQPFTDIEPIEQRRKMVNLDNLALASLKSRFIAEAEKLGCYIYPAEDDADAMNKLINFIGDESAVLAWADDKLPFPIADALQKAQIEIAEFNDETVQVGITGVDAALAATGSLVVSSGQGKFRTTSLLPDKHLVLVRTSQLLPDLETWVEQQQANDLAAFTQGSNTVIISGPSKTADIAQELIKGAHGPRQIHIILIA